MKPRLAWWTAIFKEKICFQAKKRSHIAVSYTHLVETFDNEFRQQYLNKNAGVATPEEVAELFDSPCLMVGIKGQRCV